MKKLCLSLCMFLLPSFSLRSQTPIYIGFGPSVYSQTEPRTAVNLTIGPCTSDAKTCWLTSFEARGSARDLASLVYSTHTGIRQVLASAGNASLKANLFTIGQVGAAVTGSATGGMLGLGGGVSFHFARWPNWSISPVMRAVYSPVNPGWQPWGSIHIGYTFR